MTYYELLNYLKYTVHPNKDKIKKNAIKLHKKESNKNVICFSVSLFCIIISLMIVYCTMMILPLGKKNSLPSNLSSSSLICDVEATEINNNFISNEASLKITTVKSVSKKELQKNLKITPEVNYKIVKTSGNTFKINFASKLKSNTLYSVKSINGNKTSYSWAFQTGTKFEIKSHYPNLEINTPNEEIHIDFSHTNVENFVENFSIKPAISGTFEHYGNRWKFIPSDDYQSNILYTVTINSSITGGQNNELENDYSFSLIRKSTNENKSKILFDSIDMISTFSFVTVPNVKIMTENSENEFANIDIYSVASAEEFAELHKSHVSDNIISHAIYEDIKNLDKFSSFTEKIEWNDNIASINYPETLPKGFYISQIAIGNNIFYQPIQITDLNLYIKTNKKYVFTVINEVTNHPISHADILFSGFQPESTNDNGIASFPFDFDKNNFKYLIIKAADSQSYVCRINTHTAKNYTDISQNFDKILENNIIVDKLNDFTYKFSNSFLIDISDEIKDTDDAIISVKSEHFDENFLCQYTAKLTKDDSVIQTLYGNINFEEYSELNFGKLSVGDYTMSISCTCDTNKNTTKTFTVKSSYSLTKHQIKEFIENKVILDSSLFVSDADLIFYDEDYEFFYTVANTILNRSEYGFSGDLAFSILYNNEISPYLKKVINDFKTDNLTELSDFISIANEFVDNQAYVNYFNNQINSNNGNLTKILCYYSLSALGQPVLNELLALYDQIDSFNYQEKLYLALGFSYAGDYTKAYEIYNKYIVDKVKVENSMAYFDASGTIDNQIYFTVITAKLCSKISVNTAKEFAKTLINDDFYTQNHSYSLLTFIKNWSVGTNGQNKVILEYADGNKETITYSKNEVYARRIKHEDLKDIKITPKDGVSVMIVNGYTESSYIPDIYVENTNVTGNYSNVSVSEKTVEINLSLSLPEQLGSNNSLTIKLPYSCEFISCNIAEADGKCFADGTNVSLQLYKNNQEIKIVCRSKFSGNYSFEPIYVIDTLNNSYYTITVDNINIA